MKKVSKVKTVNSAFNSWEKDGVTYYPHRYNMEDGTEITANHKAMNPFKPGDEVEYEIKGNDNQGNPKGSVGKPQTGGNGNSGGYKSDPKDQGVITWLSCFSSVCNNTQQSVMAGEINTLIDMTNKAFDEAKKHSSL